jgi:hypothetical protein
MAPGASRRPPRGRLSLALSRAHAVPVARRPLDAGLRRGAPLGSAAEPFANVRRSPERSQMSGPNGACPSSLPQQRTPTHERTQPGRLPAATGARDDEGRAALDLEGRPAARPRHPWPKVSSTTVTSVALVPSLDCPDIHRSLAVSALLKSSPLARNSRLCAHRDGVDYRELGPLHLDMGDKTRHLPVQ